MPKLAKKMKKNLRCGQHAGSGMLSSAFTYATATDPNTLELPPFCVRPVAMAMHIQQMEQAAAEHIITFRLPNLSMTKYLYLISRYLRHKRRFFDQITYARHAKIR